MPMPRVQPAAGQHVQRRRLLGRHHRVVLGEQQDARRQPDRGGHGGDKTQAEQRVQPVGGDGHGDAAVSRVRVAGPGLVHQHHVLARPQGGDAVRPRRQPPNHLRARARPDAKRVQPNAIPSPRRAPSARAPWRYALILPGLGQAAILDAVFVADPEATKRPWLWLAAVTRAALGQGDHLLGAQVAG